MTAVIEHVLDSCNDWLGRHTERVLGDIFSKEREFVVRDTRAGTHGLIVLTVVVLTTVVGVVVATVVVAGVVVATVVSGTEVGTVV